MSSELRLRASRAKKSRTTVPIEPEAPAPSRDARRHGLLSRQILVGKESPAAFKELFDIFLARWAPVDDVELGLIEEMAASSWRLRRAWAMETDMLETAMETQTARSHLTRLANAFGELAAGPKLNLLHRYETRLHVMYQRALHNLIVLRGAGNQVFANNFFVSNQNPESEHSKLNDFAPKTADSIRKAPARTRASRVLLLPPSDPARTGSL
jgi:hypothetical protein